MAVDTTKLYNDVQALSGTAEKYLISELEETVANTLDCLGIIYAENPKEITNLLGGRDWRKAHKALQGVAVGTESTTGDT